MIIEPELINMEINVLNGNSVKEIILARLLLDKKITEHDYLEYKDYWQIIVLKRSWFKQWLHSNDKNAYYYKFVKMDDNVEDPEKTDLLC
jgi:hypothetical protein